MVFSRFARQEIETHQLRLEISVERLSTENSAAYFGNAALRVGIQTVEIGVAAHDLKKAFASSIPLGANSAPGRKKAFEFSVTLQKLETFVREML